MFVEIYTKENCSYCKLAKAFLAKNNISFSESKLDRDITKEYIKEKFPNALSFPIIILDGFFVGGYNELKEHINANNSDKILLNEGN
jgi:glutaredoxin 3